MPNGYIFDTCVFNRLADGKIRLSDISTEGTFFATQLQRDELSATRNDERREKLMAMFEVVGTQLLATETFCFDISHMDIDKWGDGQLFNRLKASLDSKQKKRNNTHDALIAEVAIVQQLILVTADGDLADVAEQLGANVRRIP